MNAIVYKKEWEEEDNTNNESDMKGMSKVCQVAMNSIAENLEFTV